MRVYASVHGQTQVFDIETNDVEEARTEVGSHLLLSDTFVFLKECRVLAVVK